MENDLIMEDIKKQLGIKEWAELSKTKLFELFRIIEMNPNIDKEVYLEIIKNVPQIIEVFKEAMNAFKETLNQSKKASEDTKRYYAGLADKLVELLSNPNSSEKDKDNIFKMLSQINLYIDELDKRDKDFFGNALKVTGVVVSVFLLIFGAVTGIKIDKPKA